MSFHCECCNVDIVANQKRRHFNSLKHLNNVKKDVDVNENVDVKITEEIKNVELKEEDEVSDVVDYNIIKKSPEEDHSLEHLNNVNFVFESETVKEPKVKKEKERTFKIPEEIDELFSDHPTEILGRDKHFLINKVRQYKALFSSELRSFKMKKKPTIVELEKAIEEIEVIIAIKNIDVFIVQSILESIKMVEGFSAMTKFNIQGLADILKSNPQFLSLSKQLFLRYGSFVNVPAEYQMLILVSTTAYLCIQKNAKKQEMNNFLNEPVRI